MPRSAKRFVEWTAQTRVPTLRPVPCSTPLRSNSSQQSPVTSGCPHPGASMGRGARLAMTWRQRHCKVDVSTAPPLSIGQIVVPLSWPIKRRKRLRPEDPSLRRRVERSQRERKRQRRQDGIQGEESWGRRNSFCSASTKAGRNSCWQ